MNQSRKRAACGSYVALTSVPDAGNACDSIILSAPLCGHGCVETSIVPREVADARLHRAPRTSPAIRRGAASQASVIDEDFPCISSAPLRQVSSSSDVVSVRMRWPVSASVFTEIAVRELLWKGALERLVMARSFVLFAMTESSFFCLFLSLRTFTNFSQVFGLGV